MLQEIEKAVNAVLPAHWQAHATDEFVVVAECDEPVFHILADGAVQPATSLDDIAQFLVGFDGAAVAEEWRANADLLLTRLREIADSVIPRMNRVRLEPDHYTTVPPEGCPFEAGDVVTFTNEYGVVFKGQKIYGFALEEDWLHGNYVYTEGGAYWFPNHIGSFKLESRPGSN